MAADIINADWKTEAIDLLRQVDPGFHVPIYLLDMAETNTASEGAGGLWAAIFDIQLRERFRERGEWQGRGFCTIVAAAETEASFRQSGIPAFDARRKILGIVLHEAAHFIEAKELLPESRADELIAQLPGQAEYFRTAPIEVGPDDPTAEPWKQHDGARFGRIAIHMAYRANMIFGEDYFHINDLWGSYDSYKLAGPINYVEALGNEPRDRCDEPLRSIVNSPLPPTYDSFCQQDIERARAIFAAQNRH